MRSRPVSAGSAPEKFMPDLSGASRPDRAAATFFGCAVTGLCMIVLFASARRQFLSLAALNDVDHAPVAESDKAANCQGGMIAAKEQFALRNCHRPGWLSARTMHRSAAPRLRE